MKRAQRPRVLIVDDEANVQRSLSMLLRKEFDVTTASSGAEGLEAMSQSPEWDIVMSDMRMPGMDGAEFLTKARLLAPQSVRVLLTGQADTESTIAAVNDGQVFRFMQKPCSPMALRRVLGEAAEQRKLLTAESMIIESTLSQAILVLSEVLGTVHPLASLRCERLRAVVLNLCHSQGYEDIWQLDLAAALSHLGCIPLPAAIVNAGIRSEELSESDQKAWDEHPACGAGLIASIPRLEGVASIIGHQRTPPPEEWLGKPMVDWPVDVLGAEVLRTSLDYLDGLSKRDSISGVLATMSVAKTYQESILEALADLPVVDTSGQEMGIRASALRAGMVLLDDLKPKVGTTLACAGATVSQTLVRLAQNFSARGELHEPFRVQTTEEAPVPNQTD